MRLDLEDFEVVVGLYGDRIV